MHEQVFTGVNRAADFTSVKSGGLFTHVTMRGRVYNIDHWFLNFCMDECSDYPTHLNTVEKSFKVVNSTATLKRFSGKFI